MNPYKIAMNLRLLSKNYNREKDSVKIHSNNTFIHEYIKFTICYIMKRRGYHFVTEGIFNSGGQCDIFDLSNTVIYEIMHTEQDFSIELKKNKYPNVEIIKIKTIDYTNKPHEEIIKDLETKIL